MTEKTDPRKATTLRMSSGEAKLVGKLQKLRGLPTEQTVVHGAFVKGLRLELLAEGIRLYREEGLTLAEAAQRAGVPYGELFDRCVVERVTLIDDPSFLEHTAALGRTLGIPALTEAAEHVLAETLEPA